MKYNQLSSDGFYMYNKQERLLKDFKPTYPLFVSLYTDVWDELMKSY